SELQDLSIIAAGPGGDQTLPGRCMGLLLHSASWMGRGRVAICHSGMVCEKYPDSGCPPAGRALMRKVHRPGFRLSLARKCPLARRLSFNGWSAPPGVIAVALAEVMGSSLPDARKNVK